MQKSDFKSNAGEFKKSYVRNCFIWFHRKHAKRFQIKVIMHARKPFSNQLSLCGNYTLIFDPENAPYSRTKAPTQEIKRKEPAKRIHVEENQSLDVVKSFAESISANFTVLTESMTNSFQKLGENLNVMNDNIMSLAHWPESELSEDISEQLDVNEVNEASEKHSNDEQNADESATGQAEPPSKRKKADESDAPNKFLSSLRRRQIHRKL